MARLDEKHGLPSTDTRITKEILNLKNQELCVVVNGGSLSLKGDVISIEKPVFGMLSLFYLLTSYLVIFFTLEYEQV